MSSAVRRYPASLDSVRAVRTANVAPRAGMSGAAMPWTWSRSAAGTRAAMASRLPPATASATASPPTTSTQTGMLVSHISAVARSARS